MSEYGTRHIRKMMREVGERWEPTNRRRRSDKWDYRIQAAVMVLAAVFIALTIAAQVWIKWGPK